MWLSWILACSNKAEPEDKRVDLDQDGFTVEEGDCWESAEQPPLVAGAFEHQISSADIYPGAEDLPYDGVDQNCDGKDDFDADADGFVPSVYLGIPTLQLEQLPLLAGGDCDDQDARIRPDAEEIWYDGVDQNCDGGDDFDQDGDGFANLAYSGTDCDDQDPSVFPDAEEVWYDGVDQNCDRRDDFDQDGDGHALLGADSLALINDDCDDQDAQVHPLASEICDGVDNNCDGLLGDAESDLDGDGYVACVDIEYWKGEEILGGSDCDDQNATWFPDQQWLLDGDGDGYAGGDGTAVGGTAMTVSCAPVGDFTATEAGDCDDQDASKHPFATENVGVVDNNCDGLESMGYTNCTGVLYAHSSDWYVLTCHGETMTYNDMLTFCQNAGYLGGIRIDSATENTTVVGQAAFVPSTNLWLGARGNRNGGWYWYDGSTLGYTHWATGQSGTTSSDTDCITVRSDGFWEKKNCGQQVSVGCEMRW